MAAQYNGARHNNFIPCVIQPSTKFNYLKALYVFHIMKVAIKVEMIKNEHQAEFDT